MLADFRRHARVLVDMLMRIALAAGCRIVVVWATRERERAQSYGN